jgi:hypothetical protein
MGALGMNWTCAYAALNGHLEVLKWARLNGCPWDEMDVCICSGKWTSGGIPVGTFENGCPWDEETCSYAAKNGHLEVLKWARLNGCPWDEWTCASAAENGHLEVLKWSRLNGCPWDEETCSYAAENGHLEVLKWAFQRGGDQFEWLSMG